MSKNKGAYASITCTPEEKEIMYKKAESEGLKFTDWARFILLNTTYKDVLLNKK